MQAGLVHVIDDIDVVAFGLRRCRVVAGANLETPTTAIIEVIMFLRAAWYAWDEISIFYGSLYEINDAGVLT